MFAQPQRLRRFAAHVLLVWLFALGTSIANACVVQLHMQQPAQAAAQPALHGHLQLGAAPADEGADCAALHGHHQSGGQADRTHPPCERLCDAPSVAPQAEKQQSNLLSGFWLAPAPVPPFDFQSAIEPVRIALSDDARWRRAIPVSIAFLRLAL
ncbi:MAG TPA: hypothetical protein VKP68_13775 [Ramlibacter sp.]|nr:hypothetical protein [Ramlibacter sp.]